MSEIAFAAKRVVRTYRQTIEASPDVVFPLLCPVREAEWLDGWTYEMVYSESGLAEEGAVFRTPGAEEASTVWIVTRHDREAKLVEFARFTPDSRVSVLKVGVEAAGDACSHVDISYCYTSIARKGDEFLDAWTEEAFLRAVGFWERSMNHFLKTGGRLSAR